MNVRFNLKSLPVKIMRRYAICFAAVLAQYCSFSQHNENLSDTLSKKQPNIFGFITNAVTKNPDDSLKKGGILNVSGEAPFLPFEGKIIRHIIIQEFGFEKTFTDTSKNLESFGTKLLNKTHRNTRAWVIRNNLFIKEKMLLNPFIVAENEKHLRSLEFIQDARILVEATPNSADSVDIFIITKDLYSITAELNDLSTGKFKAKFADINVTGMGQKIQLITLIEHGRSPGFGYDLRYSKNNIANTFINAAVDYSTINSNLTDGTQDEKRWYLNFDRPLLSQYAHIAGGINAGHNETINTYGKPDSSFYKYSYQSYNAWFGYNLGVKKHNAINKINNRTFASIGYQQNNFTKQPDQLTHPYNFRYDDKKALLAQFTFFRQKFFKTNYIFGFGTTEDVPLGYNIAITSGFYKQANLNRTFAGIDANRYVTGSKGYFIQYFLRTGTFINKGKLEDASMLLGGSLFTKIFLYRNIKIRQYFSASYTRQFNRVALDPLRINTPFGLRNFNSDSANGDQRLTLHTETFFFTKYKLFGFKFAPFIFADATVLSPENLAYSKSDFYSGIGGGVRTRNENLVFNTIELRIIYFPRSVEGNNSFKLTLSANILFRYNSNYVKAPDIIQLNNDNSSNIY